MITSLAIRMRNRSLIEEEHESGNENFDADGPPAKKRRTSNIVLDTDEAAFASSLPPLWRTPNVERETQEGEGEGEQEQEGEGEGEGEGDEEGNNDEQEVVGFLDNGVCFFVFSKKLYQLIFLP